MSSTTPPAGEPDYLEFGSRPPRRTRRPRRGLVVGLVVGLAVAVALPLGAFAVLRLLGGGGTQPHDVLPANAVAYFRVDLDPSAPEKIDAVRFLRTFPAFERYTRITDDRADVRQVLVEAALDDASCAVDYTDGVAPWLGERFGVAVMAPTVRDGGPQVVAAIQVGDEQAARRGLRRLSACGPPGAARPGWAHLDGYMVVAETQRQADAFAAAAARRPLAEHEGFRTDMERLGDPGVASSWLSGTGLYEVFNTSVIGDPGPAGGQFDLLRDQVRRSIDRSYRSVAVAFRFDDRYAEVAAVVSGRGYQRAARDRSPDLDLPAGTAVAFGFANGAEYVDQQWGSLVDLTQGPGMGMLLGDPEQMSRRLERMLGLRLPADLQTLVGQNLTVALDGDGLDLDALDGPADLGLLDLGARVTTDTAAFGALVDRLQRRANQAGAPVDVTVAETDDGAVVATSPGYAERLAEGGTLSGTDAFTTAVPDADQAQGVLFVSVDALEAELVEQMRRDGESPEAVTNLAKVEAFGVSGDVHDGYAEALVRLTVAD